MAAKLTINAIEAQIEALTQKKKQLIAEEKEADKKALEEAETLIGKLVIRNIGNWSTLDAATFEALMQEHKDIIAASAVEPAKPRDAALKALRANEKAHKGAAGK